MCNNLFHGFNCDTFDFEGTKGFVAKPEKPNGQMVLKTEYWDAFPELEIEMLKRGFHVVHLKNKTRLANKEDCARKARFVDYVSNEYKLSKKCVLVGMSCGGAQAVNFAAFYPSYVSCIVIDAPVLNFLDFPGRYGNARYEEAWVREFQVAYPKIKRSDIFMMEENPINNVPKLIKEGFNVIMLYGNEDTTVLYTSNGKLLEEAYEDNKELLTVIIRHNQGHHPHGLLNKSDELAELVISKIK